MAFYSFPATHWQSIRTSNPIESVFGTIRRRTKRSKVCLSRNGMLHMMFKLGMCVQENWRVYAAPNTCHKWLPGLNPKIESRWKQLIRSQSKSDAETPLLTITPSKRPRTGQHTITTESSSYLRRKQWYLWQPTNLGGSPLRGWDVWPEPCRSSRIHSLAFPPGSNGVNTNQVNDPIIWSITSIETFQRRRQIVNG